ncbi:MAG: histidine kinase [Bacteroidota bacterium]
MKQKQIIYHILFWAALYLLWVLVFRSYSIAITKTMTIEFCYLIFITADYYAIINFIVPQFLLKKRNILFVTSIVITIALSAWLRTSLALQMNKHFFKPAQIPDFTTVYIHSIVNISLWVLVVTIAKMMIDRAQTQQHVELLEKERVRNELDYLKAQINPHALFNSLNTIYGHIDKNNQVARNTLLQFSELLRYQLYDCGTEKVELEKEIAYVKNYVAFQRLRKSEQLIVSLDINNIESGLTIGALLLVVLIENAFKFASNVSEKENKIIITISTKDGVLYSSFFNTKEIQPAFTEPGYSGIGISNLKRRLTLLYPGKYTLTTKIEDESYQANLILDLT